MNDLTALNNIVRAGWVSSVDPATRTARVTFFDKGKAFVSGPLKVMKNTPFIPQAGEVQQTEKEAGHAHKITISPWLPSPGDFVLCIFLPNGDGDGFVIGGI